MVPLVLTHGQIAKDVPQLSRQVAGFVQTYDSNDGGSVPVHGSIHPSSGRRAWDQAGQVRRMEGAGQNTLACCFGWFDAWCKMDAACVRYGALNQFGRQLARSLCVRSVPQTLSSCQECRKRSVASLSWQALNPRAQRPNGSL